MSREFSDEELAALEAEMERLTVDDVLLQTLVTLINLGARKAGLAGEPPLPNVWPPRYAARVHLLRQALHRLELGLRVQSAARLAGADRRRRPAEAETRRALNNLEVIAVGQRRKGSRR